MNNINTLRRLDQQAAEAAPSATMKNLLNLVRDFFPEALLVGGAVRDHVLDRNIKDYDIFIPAKGTTWADAHKKMAEKFETLWTRRRYSTPVPNCAQGHVVELETIQLKSGQIKKGEDVYVTPQGHDLEIVLVPVVSTGEKLRAWLKEMQPVPLNGGIFDGKAIALPEQAQKDLDERVISVIRDRLPKEANALRDITRRVNRLHCELGWEVRLV